MMDPAKKRKRKSLVIGFSQAFDSAAFSKRIEKEMETKGLSISKLADLVGTGQPNLSRFCSSVNADKIPGNTRSDIVYGLAKALDVSSDYLLGLATHKSVDKNAQTAEETTGLSRKAIEQLAEWKNAKAHPLYPYMVENDLLAVLDMLIASKEGNYLLGKIAEFLTTDFKQLYIENEDATETREYHGPVILKDSEGQRTYVYPEVFEKVALESVGDAVRRLKGSHEKKAPDDE